MNINLILMLKAFICDLIFRISEVSGHAPGNTGTFLYWFDAYLASTSDKCGQQKPISGKHCATFDALLG